MKNDDLDNNETNPPHQSLVGTPAGDDLHQESTRNDLRRANGNVDAPDWIDHFEIQRILGRGGFGSVFLARDARLDRMVALKLLDKLERGAARRMLDHETRAAAKLRHPNLVTVFQSGEHERGCYIVFEYVAGSDRQDARTLREVLADKGRIEPDQAVRFVRQITEALAYAHEAKVIHRDIKPENILIDFKDAAYLADFGCARQSKRHLDGVQSLVGTLPYMSLEQINGKWDVQTDIWSIGVLLYEILSGKRPFEFAEKAQSRSAAEAAFSYAVAVLDVEHVPPIEGVDADLMAICQKCLEPSADDRYASAADIVADLARWQRNEPVSCRPPGIAERASRWAQRNPIIAAQLAVITLLLVVGLVISAFVANKLATEQARYIADKLEYITRAETDEFDLAVADLQHNALRASALVSLVRTWRTSVPVAEGDRNSSRRDRLAAALVAFDRSNSDDRPQRDLVDEAEEQLQQSLLSATDPHEFRFLRRWLLAQNPQRSDLGQQRIEALWRIAKQTIDQQQQFRALVALSEYDPDSAHWDEYLDELTAGILSQETSLVGAWSNSVTPVASRLLPMLENEIENTDPERRQRAEIAFASMATTPSEMIKRMINASGPEVARELLLQFKSRLLDTNQRRLVERELAGADAGLNARQLANLSLVRLFFDGATASSDLPIFGTTPSVDALIAFEQNAARWGLPLRTVMDWIDRLGEKPNNGGVVQTAVLTLGHYQVTHLPDFVRQPAIEKVLAIHRDDPRAAVHAAAQRVLRQWNVPIPNVPIPDVPAPNVAEVPADDAPNAWRMNELGQLVVRAQLPNGKTCEVSAYEITLGDYARYVSSRAEFYSDEPGLVSWLRQPILSHFNSFPGNGGNETTYDERNIPLDHERLPIRSVSALQAVAYCVWVSEQTGVAEDQFCYSVERRGSESLLVAIERNIPESNTRFRSPITSCDRDARGYRLPFRDEWQYLASEPPTDAALMDDIGWYQGNAQGRVWPGGGKRPNRLGIFDMAGNVAEWYHGEPDTGKAGNDDVANLDQPGYVTMAALGGDFESELTIASQMVEGRRVFAGDPRIGYRLIRVIE